MTTIDVEVADSVKLDPPIGDWTHEYPVTVTVDSHPFDVAVKCNAEGQPPGLFPDRAALKEIEAATAVTHTALDKAVKEAIRSSGKYPPPK